MASEQNNERVEQIAGELISVLGTGKTVEPSSKRFTRIRPQRSLCHRRARPRVAGEARRARRRAQDRVHQSRRAENVRRRRADLELHVRHDGARSRGIRLIRAAAGTCAARIEPEIVLHLADAPRIGMNEADLAGCIDWVAHGFEIVDAIFPNWSFAAS